MKKIIYLFIFTILCLNTYSQDNKNKEKLFKAVQHIKSAEKLMLNLRYMEAIKECQSAIKQDSSLRSSYRVMYKAAFYGRKLDMVMPDFQKAVTSFKKDDEMLYYLGKTYEAKLNFSEAIKVYSDAIKYGKLRGELFLLVYDYYASRANCNLALENYDKALEDYSYAIKLRNDKAIIFANMGMAQFNLKLFSEARQTWEKAYRMGLPIAKKYIEEYSNNLELVEQIKTRKIEEPEEEKESKKEKKRKRSSKKNKKS
ncbi:MAG: hypothetical protein N4A49_03385 [Marinifilaceae bacterium]|jgi:tetratricopeptide (TPR) repeat protein|nr:hypothetical protein [Marinifilaceae bacterium]